MEAWVHVYANNCYPGSFTVYYFLSRFGLPSWLIDLLIDDCRDGGVDPDAYK